MAYKTTRSHGPLAGKDVLVARSSYSDLNGPEVLDTLLKIGGAGYGLLTGTAKAEGEAQAYRQMAKENTGSIPGWVLPVTLGGVGLFVAVILLRRRGSKGKR